MLVYSFLRLSSMLLPIITVFRMQAITRDTVTDISKKIGWHLLEDWGTILKRLVY